MLESGLFAFEMIHRWGIFVHSSEGRSAFYKPSHLLENLQFFARTCSRLFLFYVWQCMRHGEVAKNSALCKRSKHPLGNSSFPSDDYFCPNTRSKRFLLLNLQFLPRSRFYFTRTFARSPSRCRRLFQSWKTKLHVHAGMKNVSLLATFKPEALWIPACSCTLF